MRAQTCASGRKRARKAPAVRYKDEFDAATSEDEVLRSDDDNESVTRKADSKRARRQLDEDFTSSGHQQMRRQQMKDAFQPWVMQTYGDAAKTKTISRRKCERIARILRGEDRSNGADSSKFRFWVRAKGFRLGPPPPPSLSASDAPQGDEADLYVVTSTVKDDSSGEDRPVYKKVAVVEDFFDIIYREHVEFTSNGHGQSSPAGGGGTGRAPVGKHAGQKRTYRAITEIYAFLPREAVTRFLMQCAECQRRGNGGSATTNPVPASVSPLPPSTRLSPQPGPQQLPGSPTPPASPAGSKPVHQHAAPPHLLLPPTPPQQQQHWPTSTPAPIASFDLTSQGLDLSLPLTSTLLKRAALAGVSHHQLLGLDRAESSFCSSAASTPGMTAGVEEDAAKSHASANDPMAVEGPISLDLSAKADVSMDEHSPKDDDDDEDDDVEDRIDAQDPERLKAFNMFVRLFVDENLDRMVPISRQPREKVQAIIDSCVRQFPEFGERARKRIRTYLKSCRRHKRPREDTPSSSLVPSAPNRPMPPHLTSAAAEQILAQACENENQNAKRLRLGLEPISQPMPSTNGTEQRTGEQQGAISGSQTSSPSAEAQNVAPPTSAANLFRPAFGPYQRTTTNSSSVTAGPTDLSTKSRVTAPNGTSSLTGSRTSPIPHKLTPAEILAVRQLVTGYRESAAFLLRSADELEQLLQQQNASL